MLLYVKNENIQNILNGDSEIAIAMQDAVMQAYTATGAYEGKEPATGLKALMRIIIHQILTAFSVNGNNHHIIRYT